MHGTILPAITQSNRYRADIDGLRALAILPVLFNHAGVRGFSGGFVGVDIFFVISGYLITAILVSDIDNGRYSLGDFYRRRILRIFPALFFMMFTTAACAVYIMLPAEVDPFARSFAATTLFASNIFSYFETDYFKLGATAPPLLHTWSLAVEEQWYLIWPLVLGWIGAGRNRTALRAATVMSALSFLGSLWLVSLDSAAAFYLLPARIWELGLGAILALAPSRNLSRRLNEILAFIGVGLIFFAIKFYNHETEFPGAAAVLPCVGAALLIVTGRSTTFIKRILETKPMVFIGQISFSLYLWHWPVIVFAEIGLLQPKSPFTIALMISVTFVLAVFSWFFVERPFRQRMAHSRTRAVFIGGVAASVAGLAVAINFPAIAHGISGFSPSQLALSNYIYFNGDDAYRRGTCFMVGPRSAYDDDQCLNSVPGRPSILLVGDSHGAQLWPGLSSLEPDIKVMQATATGCVASLYPDAGRNYCHTFFNEKLRLVLQREEKPSAVVFASRWTQQSLPDLEATLNDPMVRASNPILVGPIPEYTTALPRLLVFAERLAQPDLMERFRSVSPSALDRDMRTIANRTGTPYVSLIDILCSGGECRTLAAANTPMQFDYGHLTPAGSGVVAITLAPFIKEHMASRQAAAVH